MFLQKYYCTIISKNTLLGRLKDYGLSRRTGKILSLETIRETRERILPLIEGPASSFDYRSVRCSLKMTDFHVPRYTIQTTAQKMKFSITDFFSKCDQIHRKLQIWSHLLKKSAMDNFIFCAVNTAERCQPSGNRI